MNAFVIDINSDVGEGVGNELELLPIISSCNIACGGHAGDEETMRNTVQLAIKYNTKIGAHPSFPDKENFGREIVQMSCASLYQTVKEQIETLKRIVRQEQGLLHHVKPHGALYNLAAKDERVAQVIIEVMKRFHQPLKLYAPYGSVIAELAANEGIRVTYEAFADRNYNNDLSLVSRKMENALITDSETMFEHIHNMIVHNKVMTIDGEEVTIHADTFCVHSDTPNVFKLTKVLVQRLIDSGIRIQ